MKRSILFAAMMSLPMWAQSASAIRGRVLDDIAHRPVVRARLSLAGGVLNTPVATYSNDQGEFQFAGVVAGRYRVSIEKAGFFNEIPYTQVDAAANGTTSVPDIILTAKRVISGVIKFRDNSPAFRAEVRVTNVSGGKVGNNTNTKTVDVRGEFVFSDLRPGRYIISAMASGTMFQGSDTFGEPVPAIPTRSAATTYLSGTGPSVANALDLRTAVEASRLTMILDEQAAGVDIEGTVVQPAPQAPPQGGPLPNGAQPIRQIQMVGLVLANGANSILRQSQVAPDGSFKLTPVPPGKYFVITQPAMQTMPIDIGTQSVRGLTITPPDTATIKGKIDIEGSQSGATPFANVRVQSRMQGPLALGGQAPVNPQGEFTLALVRGSAYDLLLPSLPPSTYIAEIKQGDDVLAGGIGVRGGGEPVHVLLKSDGGTVEGHVLAGTLPGVKSFVVLAPADRARQDLYRTANADAQGNFKLATVPPGSYSILALDRNEDDDYLDPAAVRAWESKMTSVKLDPAGSQKVELQLVRRR